MSVVLFPFSSLMLFICACSLFSLCELCHPFPLLAWHFTFSDTGYPSAVSTLYLAYFSFLHILCAFLGLFSLFFLMLCVPQCLFVLCDFQFQHSSLFSWFFSPFAFLFTFEYFLSLCLPLFDFMQFSLLAYFFVHVCVCALLCVCKGAS